MVPRPSEVANFIIHPAGLLAAPATSGRRLGFDLSCGDSGHRGVALTQGHPLSPSRCIQCGFSAWDIAHAPEWSYKWDPPFLMHGRPEKSIAGQTFSALY